jgi:hypothetical protein
MKLGLFVIALVLAGCDHSETSSDVHHKYVARHRDTFVFEGASRDHVIAPLRALLAERGFELGDVRPDATSVTTELRARTREEYVVHFIALRQRPAFTIQLVKVTRDTDDEVVSSVRDEELEWELIQRAEPDRALAIMETANARADKVPVKTLHR